jgi:hypothetical protein
VDSSDHIDCDCGHFGYTCWAIQLNFRLERVQDTVKFVDQRVTCHSRGGSVNDFTTFVVPSLVVFVSGLQHGVTGVSNKVYY